MNGEMTIHLGKIESVDFEIGGYQDCMIQFRFTLSFGGYGSIKTFGQSWSHVTEEELNEPNSRYKWSHEGRLKDIGQAGWTVINLMKDAKVNSLSSLKGKPVRVYCVGNTVDRFEILKEVL